jgi:hypothetical protein
MRLAVQAHVWPAGDAPAAVRQRHRPPAPTVKSVVVTGPEGAAETGDSAQLTATATLPNGTLQNATGEASWQSTAATVATVNAGGTVVPSVLVRPISLPPFRTSPGG